jgi:hypothetical protein
VAAARCRGAPRRTLMRTPFVKRQTTPLSGFLLFFPPCGSWRAQPPVSCPDLISVHGYQRCGLPQTLIEVPSSLTGRWQSSIVVILCDLARMSYPHPVLRTGLAAHGWRASEAQVRERGSPRKPEATNALCARARARVQAKRGLRERGPRRTAAFQDAAMSGFTSVLCRRIPCVSSAAPGSRALLPEGRRHGSRAKAVGRVSIQETARARLCARIRRAVPLSGFFSNLANNFCPGACPRRPRVAASDKAPVRWAFPLLGPAVPPRLPPDSLAHLMRRHSDATSCPRGKRSIWCMSSSRTRRRILPRPRHRLSEGQGLGVVWLGRFEDKEFEVAAPLVIRGDQREVDCQGLRHRRVLKPLGAAFPRGFLRDFLADFGQGILAGGMLHMRQAFRAFAPKVRAAAQHLTGRAHRSRRALGVWQHAAAEQGGKLLGRNLRVFRLATVESFHRERVSHDEGAALCSAEVGEPIPGEETFPGDHEPLSIGGNRGEEWFWSRLHVAVEHKCAIVAQDADGHTPGMPVDPAVKRVLSGVESP